MKLNVVVFGSEGMLGWAVSEYFTKKGHAVRAVNRACFDVLTSTRDAPASLVSDADLVFNCIGLIKPAIGQYKVEDVFRVNSIFPRNLARICEGHHVKCVHITTDCVFSGHKGSYHERDACDVSDLYGLSKCAGESCRCMVIRTSIVGEEKGKSRSLIEWAKSQKNMAVTGFTNHIWNGVTTLYLAEVIEKIIMGGDYAQGVYHIHSLRKVTKFEMLCMFSEVYGLNLKITPVAAGAACDRSLASIYDLSSRYASKDFGGQVMEMRNFFKNARDEGKIQNTESKKNSPCAGNPHMHR